ncbi:MAG: hypothetical protein U0487_01185 [Patescibacteria group bacterium]
MPPFEGMSPTQKPERRVAKETIDIGLMNERRAAYTAEQHKLAELAEAGKLADELYAKRLAELIAKGDMEGIGKLTAPSFGAEEHYTEGNVEQKKHTGEIALPEDYKPAMGDVRQANILRSIESLSDNDVGKKPLNPADLS